LHTKVLADYTDADIDEVIWNTDATPRKCLGCRTPIEAFAARAGGEKHPTPRDA